jgi:hypothetical protein
MTTRRMTDEFINEYVAKVVNVYTCGTDPTRQVIETGESCILTQRCDQPPIDVPPPTPRCECVQSDPYQPERSCPGYYNTCSNEPCRP